MDDESRPRRLVGVSTKMYFDLHRTRQYLAELADLMQKDPSVFETTDVFCIPDFLSITKSIDQLEHTGVWTGAQNCFWEDSGAYTGEVSPAVLAEAGCKIVEIGHAERRRYFREGNVEAAQKAVAVARNGMIPLVCVGEKTKGDVDTMAEECFGQVYSIVASVPDDAEIAFAYEPVWAIGAAEPASADYIVAVAKELRTIVGQRKGVTRILYGGSAGPGLFSKLKEGVDGLFLGRFAHDARTFQRTVHEVASAP